MVRRKRSSSIESTSYRRCSVKITIWRFFARRSPPTPPRYGGHRILKAVFAIIDRRRMELERQAFVLGRELYKDSPKLFTIHIEALMSHEGPLEECSPNLRSC